MGWIVAIGFLVVLAFVAIALVGIYNGLVARRNLVDNAWAQIEVVLKRRFDLIPNLVETVKGYASHEAGTLERVTAARTAGMNAGTPAEAMAADNMLTGALKSIFALSEAYPDLKANTGFLDLQAQLAVAEDKIAYARQFYNDSVMAFNTAIQVFPAVLVANAFGFKAREMFDAPAEADTVPTVKF